MGMTGYPRSKALAIWIVLVSGAYLVASCGNDREKIGTVAEVPVKAPQPQQPIVREWYPRPKYPPPPPAYSPSTGPPVSGMEQPQSAYPYTYQQPYGAGQSVPESSPWYQSGQFPDHQSHPYQTEPQDYSQRRPWGEFPPLEKKKKSYTLKEQHPDTMPYGGWPGYYGYGNADPLLGGAGWGGGMYGIYPSMVPPPYAW
jgi:hypothetical protein